MSLTTDQREQVSNELKKFAADLNLTEDQKNKLREFMEQAREKVQEYRRANPNASSADILKAVASHRDQIRQQVVNFLTPEQLTKWDSAVKNAKEFLGEKIGSIT
jgi:Spy/CpxP family protein refolding chaperone